MFIDVELNNSVHFEKCLDVVPNVVLCAEEGVSLPARLAVGSNAITVCAVDTPPRLQRPIVRAATIAQTVPT